MVFMLFRVGFMSVMLSALKFIVLKTAEPLSHAIFMLCSPPLLAACNWKHSPPPFWGGLLATENASPAHACTDCSLCSRTLHGVPCRPQTLRVLPFVENGRQPQVSLRSQPRRGLSKIRCFMSGWGFVSGPSDRQNCSHNVSKILTFQALFWKKNLPSVFCTVQKTCFPPVRPEVAPVHCQEGFRSLGSKDCTELNRG